MGCRFLILIKYAYWHTYHLRIFDVHSPSHIETKTIFTTSNISGEIRLATTGRNITREKTLSLSIYLSLGLDRPQQHRPQFVNPN
jgi:hypothetical protein